MLKTLSFAKYQGTGNDFVMVDNRDGTVFLSQETIAWLCHRRFGIGADGLILLESDPEVDFRMVYFNSDGAESTFCGNGGRCVVAFAHALGTIGLGKTTFRARDGRHDAEWDGNRVRLRMNLPAGPRKVDDNRYDVHTGSPHRVVLVRDLARFPVLEKGREIRQSHSPEGINVNFLEQENAHTIGLRTYERGVEDETLSCGTGVTAAALAAHREWGMQSPVTVRTPGGILTVSFESDALGGYSDIFLEGPAVAVFRGDIPLPA